MKVVPNCTITDTGFSRASTATYVNVAGNIATAAINTVRLNFHPVTHASLGMMLEQAGTNILTYSEAVDNGAYTPAGATITANAVASPDGTTTADKLVEGGTNTVHSLTRTSNITIDAYARYTFSFFVKTAGRTTFKVRIANPSETNGVDYTFNLTTVAITATSVLGMTAEHNGTIEDYGNSWRRCSVTVVIDTFSTACNFKLTMLDAGASPYTGDSTSGLYLWGFQMETGALASSYIPTTTAAVTRSADILTSGTFGSSTVAEPDTGLGEVAWNAATNYSVGTECVLVANHRKYKRVIAGTTATSPHLDATNWIDNGPTNRWAMLDLNRNAKTTATGSMTLVVAPGKRVDSIGLVGLTAGSVRIQVMVGNVVFYDSTTVTLVRNTLTWSQYLFGSFRYLPSVVQFNVPPVSNCTIIVTLTGTTVACAGLVIGMGIYLGKAQYSATNSALNFSKIERDAYGNATLVARRSIPKVDVKTELPKSYVDVARNVRTDLNAVVAMWSGLDDLTSEDYFEALLIVGIYKEFTISIDYVDQASITLQVEEI